MPSGGNPLRDVVEFDEALRLFSLGPCGHLVVRPPWMIRSFGVPKRMECRDCGNLQRAAMPPCKSFYLAHLGGPGVVRVTADGYVQSEADIERSGRHRLNKWAHAWATDLRSAKEDLRKGLVQWFVRCQCGGKVLVSAAS